MSRSDSPGKSPRFGDKINDAANYWLMARTSTRESHLDTYPGKVGRHFPDLQMTPSSTIASYKQHWHPTDS